MGVEAHIVYVLRFVTFSMCARIREDEHAIVTFNDTRLASYVTWHARVPKWVHVANDNAFVNAEAWRDGRVYSGRTLVVNDMPCHPRRDDAHQPASFSSFS